MPIKAQNPGPVTLRVYATGWAVVPILLYAVGHYAMYWLELDQQPALLCTYSDTSPPNNQTMLQLSWVLCWGAQWS